MNYTNVQPGPARASARPASGDIVLSGRAQDWLVAQCDQLPAARAGLVLARQEGQLVPVALWPSAAATGMLLELTERAAHGLKGLIVDLPAGMDGDAPNYGIAYPLKQDGALLAVATLAVRVADEAALEAAMRQLQWGAAGLELILAHQTSARERDRVETLEMSVDLLSTVLAEPHFDAAAMAFVTGLAQRLEAERVSLGLLKGGRITVQHMSYSSQFGERMNLVRLIEDAMDEAIDQRLPIQLPPPAAEDAPPIRLAHGRLVAQEAGAVMTIPLYVEGEPVGALTVERGHGTPFDAPQIRTVESLAALAVAALEEKRENDRPLPVKIWRQARAGADVMLKPGRIEYKVAIGLGVLLVLFLLLARGTDNLSANATLAPRQSRILAAPFDGYVHTAPARAGDVVRKGQVLATLDDSDLQLDRAKWLSQLSRYGGLYQEAAAQQDRVQTNVNSAERDEAQAQLDLTNALIARSTLRAPFAGVVMSGDLSQRLGGSVNKGDVLFTVAPSGKYRVDLNVKESRITSVAVGQHGILHLSALPAHAYGLTVRKLTPKIVAENGATYFVIEAALDPGQSLAQLQPGMEGVGKIDVGRGWLFGIWTRDLSEWLRLKVWGLFG